MRRCLGRGVSRLHLVLEPRLHVHGRPTGYGAGDSNSGAKHRDGRDKDEGSMLGLDRHARNLRPAPCTPAPNRCDVYHLVAGTTDVSSASNTVRSTSE